VRGVRWKFQTGHRLAAWTPVIPKPDPRRQISLGDIVLINMMVGTLSDPSRITNVCISSPGLGSRAPNGSSSRRPSARNHARGYLDTCCGPDIDRDKEKQTLRARTAFQMRGNAERMPYSALRGHFTRVMCCPDREPGNKTLLKQNPQPDQTGPILLVIQ